MTFLLAAGAVTLVVLGGQHVLAFIKGVPPERIDSYNTMVIFALDLAIITPTTFQCAVLVPRGNPLGYVIASPLLTLVVLLAPQILLNTIY